jgi:hypothetical protein
MLFTCRKTNGYILAACRRANCEWFIECDRFCNCTFIAAYFGPFSNADIGLIMNLTGERVRQIEYSAIQKLSTMHENGEIEPIEFDDPPSLFEESLEYL